MGQDEIMKKQFIVTVMMILVVIDHILVMTIVHMIHLITKVIQINLIIMLSMIVQKIQRRRRRRNHINQDDTGIPSIKSRSLSHQINILIHVSHNALINIKTITLVPMFQIIQKLIQITNLELSYNQKI